MPSTRSALRALALSASIALVVLAASCRGAARDPADAPAAAPVAAPPRIAPPAGPELRIDFSLTDGETSKDSNEATYAFRLADGRATYSGPYGACERGQCEHRETSFAVDAAQAAALAELIRANGLFRDFDESRPTAGIGMWVRASLTAAIAGEAHRIRVDGMTSAWGRTAPGDGVVSDDARAVLSGLNALRRRAVELARGQFSEYQ